MKLLVSLALALFTLASPSLVGKLGRVTLGRGVIAFEKLGLTLDLVALIGRMSTLAMNKAESGFLLLVAFDLLEGSCPS